MAGLSAVLASQQASATARDTPAGRPGQASANAAVFSVVVQSGGTTLKPSTFGRASAAYVETQTQASSATVDLGGVGYLLTAIPICGEVLLPSSRQPQPLTASSSDGASSQTTPGNVGGLGTQSVSVSPSPELAAATTAPISQSLLGGLVQIDGTATSTVRFTDGAEQQADSSVTADLSLVGGLVRIEGMQWSASQHVGASSSSSATFSFGTVTIANLGTPVTLPTGASAATLVSTINAVVGPAGLQLTLPADSSDPSTGSTVIGPLLVHFAGSSLDSSFVTPAAQQLAQLEALISGQSANGTDCTDFKNLIGNVANPGETVGNVAVGIMQGAGSLDLGLGGANASTQPATDFANPFAAGGPTSSGGQPDRAPGQALPAGASSSPTLDQAAPTAAVSSAPTAATGTETGFLRCVTTSPAGRPGCWNGLGAAAGGLTAAMAAGLLFADVSFSRRTRRRRARSTT